MAKKIIFIIALIILSFQLSFPSDKSEWYLTILYQSDTHGNLEPFKLNRTDTVTVGGIARTITLVNRIKNENNSKNYQVADKSGLNSCFFPFRKRAQQRYYTMFIHGGDMMQGPILSNVFKGEIDVKAYSLIPIDVAGIGNHDFDFGKDNLKKCIASAKFQYVSANIKDKSTEKLFANPYIIKNFNGHKVAITGITTQETPISTSPKNITNLEFLSPKDVLLSLIPQIEKESDLIIAINHIGYNKDKELANDVSGIDIIIGGHTHTKLDTPDVVNGTLICHSGERGIFLGRLDLKIKHSKIVDYKNQLIPINNSIPEDTTALNLINSYKTQLDGKLNEVIGISKVYLDGTKAKLRNYETNLGNFIADIIKERGNADIGLINAGGIRASIDSGEVTIKEVFNVFPYPNSLVVVNLTGKQLLKILEKSVSLINEGGFLQISGIEMSIEKRDNEAQFYLGSVKVNGIPIDTSKIYKVATSDFLAQGGDGYITFKEVICYDTGIVINEMLIDYIREKKEIAKSVEGRIIRQ